MASEVLMTISRDEVERARLLSELKYELDTQSRIAYARQEGEQKGLRKGRWERNSEILKLFESGYSAEQIKERLKGDGSSPGL